MYKGKEQYIMALDQGTTSSRCIVFDRKGAQVCSAQREFRQIYPRDGWVEHDPMEIRSTQINVAQEALLKGALSFRDIAAIGVTNQRETTIVWDKATGEPVCNAIVWQCRRTAEYCDELRKRGLEEFFKERTGLLVDAYFSGTKIRWILDNVNGARRRAEAGELLFGTVETWLIWNLTKGAAHVTDISNASRTLLFNIRDLKWDAEILDILEIPASMLPEIRPSGCMYGYADADLFGGEIPIAGAAGDQQASLFGQTCFAPGDVKNTYGTGCFMLMNTGETPIRSENGLLTTVAWGLEDKVSYALEGSVFAAGAAVQWLRDEMRLIEEASDSEWMASKVSDTCGVYLVPAFVGLGAPHWDPYARGAIVGLTRGANKYHIIRAALESIAYQSLDLLEAMKSDMETSEEMRARVVSRSDAMTISSLNADGGASANNFLMQFQSDVLGVPVRRSANAETTALGAAYLAGLTSGFWEDTEEIAHNRNLDRVFLPSMRPETREMLLAGWTKSIGATRGWTKTTG
ncbi:MAG: glycerol kinase GlpK [Clostridiales Family XIII bacterium]|jgi:glycerol kinase|nr:glycerol kinase GlpK [Clostridiales Family XIII bacterium]